MPPHISDDQFSHAVLDSVQNGTYPDAEAVISAELPNSALTKVLALLEQAREDVRASIRDVSKDSAPDIDGWISQAKQLRNDIEASRNSSREIVAQAKHAEKLDLQATDAASKVNLLKGELAFNDNLGARLDRIHSVKGTVHLAHQAVMHNQYVEALNLLEEAEQQLGATRANVITRVDTVLRTKIADIRKLLSDKLTECWDALLHVDRTASTVNIRHFMQLPTHIDINTVAEALRRLNHLNDRILKFSKAFNSIILNPRLELRDGKGVGFLLVDGDEVRVYGQSSDVSIQSLLSDMDSVVDYLRTRLPPTVAIPLSEVLMPSLISTLIATWLSSSLPTDLEGMQSFDDTLASILQFAEALDNYEWPGGNDLVEWINRIPHVWLTKRRDISLDKVRKLVANGLGSIETVERVETQVISQSDNVFASNGGGDDWNAEWSDGEGVDTTESQSLPGIAQMREKEGNEEEEHVSAWGLNDDIDMQAPQRVTSIEDDADADVDAEAWGWGDEPEGGDSSKPTQSTKASPELPKSNGYSDPPQGTAREVTLKETYNITALPKELLLTITQLTYDGENLARPDNAKSPIASAASGLFAIPGLMLSMYRAAAPVYYERNVSGNMFLYNDCMWMAERLNDLAKMQSKRVNHGHSRLEADVSALEIFGKRAYSKEMETQRTIAGDLLDGAQGFVNCTEHPFAQECDIAISSTVDRIREVHKQWKAVLSHSALLQSLGSLLSTVINKIIVDVEDMSDISEPESQRLTSFCNRIASLEDLFAPKELPTIAPDIEQTIPLTAVYTPNWLKFQYLSNILESSLVDIKYLWSEGELGLEFSADELVDLIEALFADSEHRRRAIGEIRRSSTGR